MMQDKVMKKASIVFISMILAWSVAAQAQENSQKYRRSSLYSILISHDGMKYHKDIEEVFSQIPIPEKFDNHDLSVKVVTHSGKKVEEEEVAAFLARNKVGRRLLARWFNRNPETGECNVDLIAQRGLYDATYFDVELARMKERGYAALADAGEELIGNTFVVVNDIRYVDRNQGAKVAGAVLQILFAVAGGVMGGMTGNSDLANSFNDLGTSMNALVSEIKGFGVTVTSYLYRLEWDEAVADQFYTQYYIREGEKDEAKRIAFNTSDFVRLKYIGKQSVKSGNISMQGINVYDPQQMIRKVCTRAIDESLVALQTTYDEFKIKTPIFSVSPAITAKIGMKEGVTAQKRYEVLEQYQDEQGRTHYRRVGVVQPVAGRIWDNRYMATEEKAVGSTLEATTFRKISGGDFYPGLLIREIGRTRM